MGVKKGHEEWANERGAGVKKDGDQPAEAAVGNKSGGKKKASRKMKTSGD